MAAVHQPEFSTASVFPETVAFDIPADLLDQVRDSVLDGFTACGDGGVEVVGVLWGQRGSRRPRVQEFKAITAELSEPRFPPGSAFTLLTRAIEDGERDARFSRLQVLGWFRSASDEAEVVESDITLHKAISDFAFPFLPRLLCEVPASTAHQSERLASRIGPGRAVGFPVFSSFSALSFEIGGISDYTF